MKKCTYWILAGLFTFILLDTIAQPQHFSDPSLPKPPVTTQSGPITPGRCSTMEGLEIYFRNHPEARAIAERNKNAFAPETIQGRNQRTQAIVTIPVVFHLVSNTARLAQVTDADVIWQLNKMNEDFSGANADSTNAAYGFYPIRAKKDYCQIRFCLAQRTPADLPTNGIDRVVSILSGAQNCSDYINNGDVTLVKHASNGGADAWDPNRFFNIWVAEFDNSCGLLGIASFPGTGAANEQGIVINFRGFSNNPAYVNPSFALGRTAVHEAGHYFGLFHIWGDDAGCTNSDFRQLPGTCLLPASLAGTVSNQLIGDTPNQDNSTSNCLSGMTTDGCAATAPGKNYQNYMDYTPDACFSMFTITQVDRMQWVLDNCRASLKTSNGCTPPLTGNFRDLQILSVSPDVVCTPAYAPVAIIQNKGTEIVTAYKVSYTIGTGAPVTTIFTGVNLGPSSTATVMLTGGTLSTGANNIKIYTWEPVTVSGTGDQYTINDTIARTGYATSTVSSPLIETFEGSFLPAGWGISNPDGATTWQKSTTGFNSSGSSYLKNFGYLGYGQKDDMHTPVFNYTGVDSVKVSFDLSAATKVAPNGSIPMDTLEVLVTRDCGNTFTSVYKKWGTQLQTINGNTPVTTEFTPNANSLWRNEIIDLTSFRPNGPLQLLFRNTTNNQNNVFIDNVNFTTRTLPLRLKTEGFLALPNPFAEQFNIWYVQAPADLRFVTVYNAIGQLIWNKVFSSGSTTNVIPINLAGKSAGVYIVSLGYSDKSKNQQISIMKSD